MAHYTRIYVEGGGDKNKAATSSLRQGLSAFLQRAGVRQLPRNVACGGRSEAFKDFVKSLAEGIERPLLLVDSEGVVEKTSKWEHLERRDKFHRPEGAKEDQCQLFVQQMESWLLADTEALVHFFGQGFNPKKLPKTRNVDTIDRKELMTALEQQARLSAKRGYQKSSQQGALLTAIRPDVVRQRSPSCDSFLKALDR